MIKKLQNKKTTTAQEGQFLVIGLILFIGLLIPIFAIVSNISITTNASTQAHGMAYNLAFASANRAVDINGTRNTGSLVLFRESQTGDATDEQGQANLQSAYSDINNVSSKMFAASGLFGDNDATKLKIKPRPDVPLYTGYSSPGRSNLNGQRWAGFISIPFAPLDVRYAVAGNCDPNAGQPADGVGGVAPPTNQNVTYCWVDGRAIDRDDATKRNPENPQNLESWAHFSSGAEIHLETSRKLPFGGGEVSLQHVGVSTFGRPCDPTKGFGAGDPAALAQKRQQCRY